MEEKDLEHCDKLMSQRDHGDLLRPADRLLVYADLADQVPGLVAEVRRLNIQKEEALRAVHNTLLAYCEVICQRHGNGFMKDVIHSAFCMEMSDFIMKATEKRGCEKHVWQSDLKRGPGSYCQNCNEAWLPA